MCLAGTVATFLSSEEWDTAVCGGHEMRRGLHYATFTLRSLRTDGHDPSFFGVVGVGFDATDAHSSPQGWMLSTGSGNLWHTDRTSEWEGQPEDELEEGDVVVRPPLHSPLPTA